MKNTGNAGSNSDTKPCALQEMARYSQVGRVAGSTICERCCTIFDPYKDKETGKISVNTNGSACAEIGVGETAIVTTENAAATILNDRQNALDSLPGNQ